LKVENIRRAIVLLLPVPRARALTAVGEGHPAELIQIFSLV